MAPRFGDEARSLIAIVGPMSTKPHLVDPVHLFDERGHALSSYDVQETVIQQLREENARLRSNLAKINSILAKSKAANAAKSPPRMH